MSIDAPAELVHQLKAAGQDHVWFGWNSLSAEMRTSFVRQLQSLDIPGLAKLYALRDQKEVVPDIGRIQPLPVEEPQSLSPECRATGEAALQRGEVAVLVVAGGQGSRLGFEHPKGMFPIGPISNKSLFQIHAEKILALTRKFGREIPFLVMTSHATHAETVAFFQQHNYFGLSPAAVHFFQQGTMPALDIATGKLLLEKPGTLFLSPNGHGGTLTALADSGHLTRLRELGIRHLYYFQVDNALLKIADPDFLGHHIRCQAEVSSKVIYKETPGDKMGVFVLVDGRCSIIEYSDLPAELANATDPNGVLRYRAGNPAIHIFDLNFLNRIVSGELCLPFHVARKKVPCLDSNGLPFTPTTENALKFEMFIFDALPLANRWTALATSRSEEFVPLKNAKGTDSPEMVRQALCEQATARLRAAGAEVGPGMLVEISPLFDWSKRSLTGLSVLTPTYFS